MAAHLSIQGPYYQPAILRPLVNPCLLIFSYILITNLQIFSQGQGSLMTFAEGNCRLTIEPPTACPIVPFSCFPFMAFASPHLKADPQKVHSNGHTQQL